MHTDTRRRLLKALAVSPLALRLGPGRAAIDYPNRPVTLVVPQPAGGGADALCRTLQGSLQERLGQAVVIENKAGAAGNIGTALGLGAAADGYTVTFVNLSTMALNPHLYAKTGYAIANAEPVIWLTSVAYLLVVNPQRVQATTLQDFIALAKREPGKLSYGTAGNGSTNHLCGEMLKKMAGIDLLHVPYKGGAPSINALLAGDIDAAVADPLAVLPHVKAGKIRVLAVTTPQRVAALPAVPSIAESGVPGYDATSWAGIVVPKGVPAPIVRQLYEAFAYALQVPEVSARLTSQLYEPVGRGAVEFAKLIESEDAKWARLIKQLGVKLD